MKEIVCVCQEFSFGKSRQRYVILKELIGMKHKYLLTTARLQLRKLTENDVDNLFSIIGKVENMPFYPAPYTRAATQDWIQRSRNSYEENDFGLWAIWYG